MILPTANDRRHGINAAIAYLMRKQENFDAVACVKEWGAYPAKIPSLFGMNLAKMKVQPKNILGKILPNISL